MRTDQIRVIRAQVPEREEQNAVSGRGNREVLFRSESLSVEIHYVESGAALHYHDCYELEVALGGEAENRTGEQSFRFNRGSMVLLSQAEVHSLICTEPMKVLSVKFTDMINGAEMMQEYRFPVVRRIREEQTARVEMHLELFREEIGHLEREYARRKLAEHFVGWLLAYALEQGTAQKCEPACGDEQVLRAVEYVRMKFREPLSLRETARVFGYSPNYLGVRFHRAMGMSFRDYVCEVRLEYARGLLCHSGMTVQQISGLCGFETASYFGRCFRKKYGMTPAQFRRNR